jgi:hypothetical protein
LQYQGPKIAGKKRTSERLCGAAGLTPLLWRVVQRKLKVPEFAKAITSAEKSKCAES